MTQSPQIGPLVQSFFVEHLLQHKRASPQTVAAYRDGFRLLLNYLHDTRGIQPSALRIADLDAPVILPFLDYLEQKRENTVQTRNARLATIRSFFRYVALRQPDCLDISTRVLAIPCKRSDKRLVGYLTRKEIEALLDGLDRSKWGGQRDHALLLTLYNTGARVSEIISVKRSEITFGRSSCVLLHGKGRKERTVPLWANTAQILRAWFHDLADTTNSWAFPNARRGQLSRHGVTHILAQAVSSAKPKCPSLATKRVSPHIIRHTTAMHLLQSGVDISVIALWLGHESIETTHMYVEADLTTKEQALEKLAPIKAKTGRFQADDALMSFLANL